MVLPISAIVSDWSPAMMRGLGSLSRFEVRMDALCLTPRNRRDRELGR